MRHSTLPPDPAGDRHWRGDARLATGCALGFLVMTLVVDGEAGTLTLTRALLWFALSAVLFVVLLPHRVTAGPGWLTVDSPLVRRTVHTDALTVVRQYGDVSARLLLRDAHGHWLELDPRVLIANPLLWHELDTGIRRSMERGTLEQGTDVRCHLGHLIDDETARSVLRASGIS